MVGERTWTALGQKPTPPVSPPAADAIGAAWYNIAQAEIGVRENARPGEHTQRIIEYHATTTLKATTDETAWCSSFVNWAMVQAGLQGTNSAAAKSWINWGHKLTFPQVGAVVVIKKKNATSDKATGSTSGTEVYAIDAGVVIVPSTPFYRGTNAMAIKHKNGQVVRYCEILDKDTVTLPLGATVTAGQVIAHVGKMFVDSMLHFEVYEGTAKGDLTNRSNPPYQRRSDLLDPTSLLDRLAWLLHP